MSCQSLGAARAFTSDKDLAPCGLRRSVRFSSESRGSRVEERCETGAMSLSGFTVTSSHSASVMSQSAPSPSVFDVDDTNPPPAPSCRFPKLEECAHFHYERVSLGGLALEVVDSHDCETDGGDDAEMEGWITLKVRSHVASSLPAAPAARAAPAPPVDFAWRITRSAQHFMQLDDMLHRCIYDRKVSGLPNLSEQITASLLSDKQQYRSLIQDYAHHLSMVADDSLNCGPALNWLQCDNRGHKLLVANEDSSSINTPAVAAAYSVRKYVSQARDEISFEVGDMISIIDMPGPNESVWWRGKRGFRVGLFPRHCVAVIGDKVPRHMTQPPPIVGSVAVAPIKPVLRKHGKLISLFRSFILSRPSRRSLKQQGILRERVFGCDLGEHLLNTQQEVPLVLVECARIIEERGAVDGIYRLSGGAGLTQRLRAEFDGGAVPTQGGSGGSGAAGALQGDVHALSSLLKMYFRELPNPLCTYQLYESFVAAVQSGPDESTRLAKMRETVVKLPPPHYRTLAYLMRHLRRVSLLHAATGMTARNMAIVWAPNLLRSPHAAHALAGVAVQAVVTEFLICYAEELFSQEQGADSVAPAESCVVERDMEVELRRDAGRRPRSLPLHAPAKLLSLEEARRRGRAPPSPCLPPPSGAIAAAAAKGEELRPAAHLTPKYIEVGSGPNNLPQYHTVLELPAPGKRGLKRSPSGWRGLFSRSKRPPPAAASAGGGEPALQDSPMPSTGLRPVKSYESLQSETDALPPMISMPAPLKQHTRSASCDSYFEPWQCELADMRLRLAPQERDTHMFSEEDDTNAAGGGAAGQICSSSPSPGGSDLSAEPSPRRELKLDVRAARECADRQRNVIEEQLSQIGYIDGDSPRSKPPEKRHSAATHDLAKRLCMDRDSPKSSMTDFQSSLVNVKLRDRGSPRKSKSRYSGHHQPLSLDDRTTRLSWPSKDNHSTLIKIDWPESTLSSTVNTPLTPSYDPLESDSEASDLTNKQTIKIVQKTCDNCVEEKCLKCELKATDFEGSFEKNKSFRCENFKDKVSNYRSVTVYDDRDMANDSKENIKDYGKNYDRISHQRTDSDFDTETLTGYDNATKFDSVTDFKIGEPVTEKELTIKSDISYQNLNRLSDSSAETARNFDNLLDPIMTSSHESSSTFSNVSPKNDDLYECYSFPRPNYLNLNSSSSKSSPNSPTKSPLKSTISITFRSPTKSLKEIDRDSIYEDINIDKQLSIVEDASVPNSDANLPLQEAAQPKELDMEPLLDLTPLQDNYSQVKFFKKSIEEVNALIIEKDRHYENVPFPSPTVRKERCNDYENIHVGNLKICDSKENGNVRNINVRELAIRFESPTEPKSPFVFEKFKTEVKYPTLEKKDKKERKSPDLAKTSKSLDENAFAIEFSDSKAVTADLNLNLNTEEITPTTENKISLIQRFDLKDTEQLSRERIEKYKEERRNFLREKYSSQSFRSNPENLTRIKIKKDINIEEEKSLDQPKFERRNTVDLGQRMRFSLAKSAGDLDTIESPTSENGLELATSRERGSDSAFEGSSSRSVERKEKMSPSYNIRDMTAIFEQKTQNTN